MQLVSGWKIAWSRVKWLRIDVYGKTARELEKVREELMQVMSGKHEGVVHKPGKAFGW